MAARRVAEGLAGLGFLYELLATHGEDPAQVVVGTRPTLGRQLSRASRAAVLRRAGRQRSVEGRAAELQAALRAPSWSPRRWWLRPVALPWPPSSG